MCRQRPSQTPVKEGGASLAQGRLQDLLQPRDMPCADPSELKRRAPTLLSSDSSKQKARSPQQRESQRSLP